MTEKKNYSNLVSNITREREEIAKDRKNFQEVEGVLARKYKITRPPYVREGISVTEEEVDLAKEIRGRMAQYDPLKIPTKSEIYRAGLHILNQLNTQEISEIIATLS
ncbi:MAG: hypothetical protein LBR43_00930 [Spiroplasmataceae bacterium]|jgi:type I restriction-modification system DNA methylase subunit|nr:hypothetical protein [Spiroplasmataceae bacterium]